jgi:hypothetical protein
MNVGVSFGGGQMVWVPLTFNDALHLTNSISCYSHQPNLSIPRLCRSNVYGQRVLQIYRSNSAAYLLLTGFVHALHWGHTFVWTAATKAHSVIRPTMRAKFGDMPDGESRIRLWIAQYSAGRLFRWVPDGSRSYLLNNFLKSRCYMHQR